MLRQRNWVALLLGLLLIVLVACGPAGSPDADDADADTPEVVTEASEEDTGLTTEIEPLAPESPAQLPATATDELLALLPAFEESDIITTESGLQYVILEEGSGAPPNSGDTVITNYTGYLTDGTKFDSSLDRGQTFDFPIGAGSVIGGWDEGFALLSPGSKAILIIPPGLGYGATGSGTIPPNATLYFEVELVDVEPVVPPVAVAEEDYVTTESGLKYYDIEAGDGATPEDGEVVTLEYTFWDSDGIRYGSSGETGQPLVFPLGVDRMFAGLEEGVSTMQVGGLRQIVLTPALTAGSGLPEDRDFIFELELIDIAAGPPQNPTELEEAAFETAESGVRFADITVGDGAEIEAGEQVQANFTAWNAETGEIIASSQYNGAPFPYTFGQPQVPGWAEGLAGMRLGGVRQVIVPAELAAELGEASGIIFEVELVAP